MNPEPLSLGEMAVRLALASLVGVVCGYERSDHGRAAGLRTTLLVAVASAVAMIVSENLFAIGAAGSATWRPDPARLAAGVLTGIGFLGAGTIIRQDNLVRGVTTAAVLWLVTILGLAFGAGQWAVGGLGFAVALIALFLLPRIELLIKSDWYGSVSVTAQMDGASSGDIRQCLEGLGLTVKGVKLESNLERKQRTISFAVKFKKGDLLDIANRAVEELARLPGVAEVKWS
jgi:putative Mg2+ transporter-C (MgtC) family protein